MEKNDIKGITHNAFFTREEVTDHYWGFAEEWGENLRVFDNIEEKDDKIICYLMK